VIVLDSSFLIAYHNTLDVHHGAAARVMVHLVAGKWGRASLLEYVFLEVVTVLERRLGHGKAVEAAHILLDSTEVDFVPCSDLFVDALRTFESEESRGLSFADAAIATLARRNDPGFVATFDGDFERLKGVTVVSG
jgi:predicted nucleic acid-binding protein